MFKLLVILYVSFISIALVVVKLKIFKILHTFLTQIWSSFAEIFSRDSISAEKSSVSIIFQKSAFLRKWHKPKVCFFVPTLTPPPLLLPEDGSNREK